MALGFVGPTIKRALNRRGYIITRPTEIERKWLRSYWRELFSRDPALFGSIYAKNREALQSVPSWVSTGTLGRSLWRYGVPLGWVDETEPGSIDRTVLSDFESEITSADLLGFVARLHFREKLSYLEIGVSVGKNLHQVQSQVLDASFVGIDIEEINPVLREQFSSCEVIWRSDAPYPVQTLSKGIVQKNATCVRLVSQRTGNTLDYVSADQFRDDTWASLKGRHFNLVFSDGVHTPEALRSELQFLIKYELIHPSRFVMFWDDLNHPEMQRAFLDNAKSLCRMFDRGDEAISLFVMHGSYGMKRPMGIFSSLQ
jgi:hypothetical protein